MLISSLPFLPMPREPGAQLRDAMFHSVIFREAAGFDRLANKGAGVVLVAASHGPTSVAFTHLNAAYDDPEQHADVRRAQLMQIAGLLAIPNGPDPRSWAAPVVLMGDLDVVADRFDLPSPTPARETEFQDVFVSGRLPPYGIGNPLQDGWMKGMPSEDRGFTHQNGQRLDYLVVSAYAERGLVAHHQRVLHRGISDHDALWGSLALERPFCTPRSA